MIPKHGNNSKQTTSGKKDLLHQFWKAFNIGIQIDIDADDIESPKYTNPLYNRRNICEHYIGLREK